MFASYNIIQYPTPSHVFSFLKYFFLAANIL